MKIPVRPILAITSALLLSACASTSQEIGKRAVPAPAFIAGEATGAKPVDGGVITYQLQTGDVVDVKLYYNPELNEQLVISPDSKVSLQLIGEINTMGMSPKALGTAIETRYAKTLRNPQATVILRKYALPRIFVSGEVNAPAAHSLDGGRVTAMQAIFQSGGFRRGAERSSVIVLRQSGGPTPLFIKLDLQAHLEQTAQTDIVLQPYDIVFVPQKRIAEVAEFFEEYVNKIVPIYRNLGFNFSYIVRTPLGSVVQ